MSDYKTKSVCVFDQGLFCELARTLAKSFGRVGYFRPYMDQFTKQNLFLVGSGIPNVERIEDFWGSLDDWDLFVFPDTNHGSEQAHLEKLGKRVWGSRYGEDLELFRAETKEVLKREGFHVGPYKVIVGLANLREFLQNNSDVYVKISRFRGDFESFHSPNYPAIRLHLDKIAHQLGQAQDITEFVVEKAIPDAVEIGYDGYSVDGQFPAAACCGLEVKDKGYVGHFLAADKQPKQLSDINSKMVSLLAADRYRNFFSLEARVTKDGTPWVIDPCCRFGSPPSEMLQEMYTNLPDILWNGAEGKCVDPIPAAEWGAELILHAPEASETWQPVLFPPKLRDSVKLRNFSVIGGVHCVMPQGVRLPEIGAVVGLGNSMEEAIAKATEVSKQLKGYGMDFFNDCFEEAQSSLEKLESYGIKL